MTSSGQRGRVGQRERHAHLEELAFEREAGGDGEGIVVVVTAMRPEGDVAAAVGLHQRDRFGEELVAPVGGAGTHDELHRPLAGVVVREVRVGVAGGVEEAEVAPAHRVHTGPRVVTEGNDAGGQLDRVGQRVDAPPRRRRRSHAAPVSSPLPEGSVGPDRPETGAGMEIDRYEPGVPSWVDIGSPDPQGAADFYGALFGWEAPAGPEEAGGYRVAMVR